MITILKLSNELWKSSPKFQLSRLICIYVCGSEIGGREIEDNNIDSDTGKEKQREGVEVSSILSN